jgi:FAD/FMN-containing dehydrogenase
VLLSQEGDQGLVSADPGALEAVARGGTKIHRLSHELLARGLALENQGDIDVQALAGAIATATHGTGRTLGNLSTYVLGLRLVLADGSVIEIDERDPGRLPGARVSLGLLGVVSSVRLRVLPAYRLRERIWRVPIEECLSQLEQHIARNRHFEFFWFPHADKAEMKTLHPLDQGEGGAGEEPAADGVRERIGWSADIISSVRELRFHEMEYALPAEAGPACFREVRSRMRERHPEVVWPVEYRTVAADDAWLSPHCGRASVTLSIHQGAGLPHREFFLDLEPILRAHGGRPHWGKFHGVPPDRLRELYPDWDRFCRLRSELDPDGRFLNDYLRGLFG